MPAGRPDSEEMPVELPEGYAEAWIYHVASKPNILEDLREAEVMTGLRQEDNP
jgi:hypothetical protein